ncbi:MAG: hypothetical protein CVT95_05415 [Bacteroidetes bacterium HGW-Bacteroidetes-12]|nr:MAG: hypothetical protein CVT95_05415 [Bacteroidetes bacterium HGW-Bacteroidetes-12]
MNLIAGKSVAIIYFLLADRLGVKLNKYHTSSIMSILRGLDFRLIEEISSGGDFSEVIKKWSVEIKEVLNKDNENIELDDVFTLLRNCNLSNDILEDITLSMFQLYEEKEGDKDEINNEQAKIFDSLGVESDVVSFISLEKAFRIPKEIIPEINDNPKELIPAIYFCVHDIRMSVVIHQASKGIKSIDEYNLLSDVDLIHIIREDDVQEIFPDLFSKEDVFRSSYSKAGIILLDLLEKLRPLISDSQSQKLFDSLVRIFYGNRPPKEVTIFDYFLLKKIAKPLNLLAYLESVKMNLSSLSKGYIIVPKLSYDGFYLHTKATIKSSLNELILKLAESKIDLSFINPEKMSVESLFIPTVFVDCNINIEWICAVESHRTEGKATKIGSVEIPSEDIHFAVVEENTNVQLQKSYSLSNDYKDDDIIQIDRSKIIENSKTGIQDGFIELDYKNNADTKIKEIGKNTNYFREDIINDLALKYPGKKYRPDSLHLYWKGFDTKKSFFAMVFVPLLKFNFEGKHINFLPLNNDNNTHFEVNEFQTFTNKKVESAKSIRNIVFAIIGIWMVFGLYRAFISDESFSDWFFTWWWWVKVIFFTTLFILTLVGYYNYIEDEKDDLEKSSLESLLSLKHELIDTTLLNKRISKLKRKKKQFSIFNYLDKIKRLNKYHSNNDSINKIANEDTKFLTKEQKTVTLNENTPKKSKKGLIIILIVCSLLSSAVIYWSFIRVPKLSEHPIINNSATPNNEETIESKENLEAMYAAAEDADMIEEEDLIISEEKNDTLSEETAITTETWVVVLGSFKTENEASGLIEKCKESDISIELLNTNNFEKLTKNFYFVAGGKNLDKESAKIIENEIKSKGFDAYAKDGGISNYN